MLRPYGGNPTPPLVSPPSNSPALYFPPDSRKSERRAIPTTAPFFKRLWRQVQITSSPTTLTSWRSLATEGLRILSMSDDYRLLQDRQLLA
jgi:hypothetical protein